MGTSKLQFFDASDRPAVVQRVAAYMPEWRAMLLDAGFVPVGVLRIKAPGLVDPHKLRKYTAEEDINFMFDEAEHGGFDDIFASPDGRAFASIEQHVGGPLVLYLTMSADGRLVETAMRPRHDITRIDMAGQMPAWLQRLGGFGRALYAVLRLGTYHAPIWPHANLPRYGQYVELVDTSDPLVLWQRHQQRVLACLGAAADIPPHGNLRIVVASVLRTFGIVSWQVQVQDVMTWVSYIGIFVALWLILGVTWSASISLVEQFQIPFDVLVVPLLALLGMALMSFPVGVIFGIPLAWIYALIARHVGRRPRPLAELLAEVRLERDEPRV